MKAKHKKLDDNNYWPGYVDALVNVVLNMLFMVGIMAVGLISLNIEALGNFKLMRQAKQLYQINEDNMLLAALGTFIAAIPEVPKTLAVPPKPEPPKPVVAPPPPPPPPPVQVARPEPPRPAPPRMPTTLRVGRLQAAPVLVDEKQLLSERLQWGDQASVSVLEFEPFVFQISPTQINQLRQLVTQTNAGRWSLAVSVDGDERITREAFWRLSQVRQQLLAAGIPQDAIVMRTVNILAPNTGSTRRVFVAHIRNS